MGQTRVSPTKPLVGDTARVREAMENLRVSGRGLVCVCDSSGRVVGVCTDGDLRNALLNGATMDDSVTAFMTREFVHVRHGASREHVLKLLDGRVKAIPVLDDAGRFVDVASSGYSFANGSVYARAKAPVRLSLAGGGTDMTRHFMEHNGVCLSATMARYSHVTVRRRRDSRVRFFSRDMHMQVEADSLDDLEFNGQLDLLKAGARIMRPDFGFDLYASCDYAPGSGLGGSAALLVAVVACFSELATTRLDLYEIAEHAFEAERIELGIAGGWQDQYSTVFGGFNFIHFTFDRNLVMPLRMSHGTQCELEERLLICHTGQQHLGSSIQDENRSRSKSADHLKMCEELTEVAHRMRDDLLRGHLDDFGRMLNETWRLKRLSTPRATNDRLDAIYNAALTAGAEGGRLLGTGGGGFFLFAVNPFRWHEVANALEGMGLKVDPVVLDTIGLRSWTFNS